MVEPPQIYRNMSYNSRPRFISISLILGLSLLGFFIFKGLKTFSDKDRVVKVKGLAEMDITAISARINLNFSFSGDNLQKIIRDTENKKKRIISYLKAKGFEETKIKVGSPEITDKEKYYEDQWKNGTNVSVKINRYSSRAVFDDSIRGCESNRTEGQFIEVRSH